MLRQYELVERVKSYDPDADEALLNRAYVFSMQMHGSQLRASGDPYFRNDADLLTTLAANLSRIEQNIRLTSEAETDQLTGVANRKAEAAKALELNPGDPLMLYNAACFYAQLGEMSHAVDTLRNAVIAGYENFEWAKRDSDLDGLRDEPGYIDIMKGK